MLNSDPQSQIGAQPASRRVRGDGLEIGCVRVRRHGNNCTQQPIGILYATSGFFVKKSPVGQALCFSKQEQPVVMDRWALPGPRGLVLSALVRLSGRCTGRALAGQAGVPTATTARILVDLVEAGMVEVTPAGRAMLYCLNRDHLTARSLVELAGLRFELVKNIRQEIEGWEEAPMAAWLFGSTARGDGDRGSDIDLFFISAANTDAARWQEQLGRLASRVEAMTGNPVQIVEHTFESFQTLEASGSKLTKALRVEGIELVPACSAAIAKGRNHVSREGGG